MLTYKHANITRRSNKAYIKKQNRIGKYGQKNKIESGVSLGHFMMPFSQFGGQAQIWLSVF